VRSKHARGAEQGVGGMATAAIDDDLDGDIGMPGTPHPAGGHAT
jgi:hypothetical protein